MSLGVTALLLDVDGVLVTDWKPLPGAPETIEELRRRGVPFRFLTNTTTKTRRSLAGALQDAGFEVDPSEVLTAPSATAAYLRDRHPGARCFLVAKGDVADDLEGIELVDDGADVVVIGGAEENFTYDNLNRAFRMLLDGAALVTMHRNLYWKTSDGPTLDAGAFVAALEHAAGTEATVVGKPAAAFFDAGVAELGAPRHEVAMVGDDVQNDVLAARAAGLRGILVRTGKFNERALQQAGDRPDAIIDSIADVPEQVT